MDIIQILRLAIAQTGRHRPWTAPIQIARGRLTPGLLGMGLSFFAGLGALRRLSRWLEQGRRHYFGIYCLVAAVVVWRVG